MTRKRPEEEAVAVMRGGGLEPLTPYPGTLKPWQCKCLTCGRIVSPSFMAVRNGAGTGCRYCAGMAIDPADAVREMRAAHLEPQTPYPGTLKPWPCICTVCGKSVRPLLNNIRKGQGCEYCSRRKVDSADAKRIMRAAGLRPLTPYPGALKKWPCQCVVCGNVVTPLLNNTRRGIGCRFCAATGFQFAAPAVVYVMCHPLGSVKIGVCGLSSHNTRVAKHQRYGWELYQQLRLSTGEQAYRIEQTILKSMRGKLRKGGFMSPETMPQGGWTETFDAEIVSAETMWKIVQDQAKKTLEPARQS